MCSFCAFSASWHGSARESRSWLSSSRPNGEPVTAVATSKTTGSRLDANLKINWRDVQVAFPVSRRFLEMP